MNAVELRGITKTFGSVRANQEVSIRVERGTIHGVIGENGAGKSTAMKILYGMVTPDSGEILIHGKSVAWRSCSDAIRAGVGMVHQHFMLAGPYTVLDNIILGNEPVLGRSGATGAAGVAGWTLSTGSVAGVAQFLARVLPRKLRPLDRSAARKKLERLASEYRLEVDLGARVQDLPVGVQQRVEILKLLYQDAEILILDEPTAVLTPQETDVLFENLRELKKQGKTILVITHKLREVMAYTDRVSILRAGQVTGEVETSQTSAEDLAFRMVGRRVVLEVNAGRAQAGAQAGARSGGSLADSSAPLLQLRDVRLDGQPRPKLDRINLSVRAGEVVGVAGVEGNGQSELIQAILHPSDSECRTSGEVRLFGEDVSDCSVREIRAKGVGVIPEDRHHEGLLLERPLGENFLLGHQRESDFSRYGFLNVRAVNDTAERVMKENDVRGGGLGVNAGALSGGNQQKLIIGREFLRKPRVLIAAQPTRGVDVGAIEAIHARILQARDEGAGVLLISSELDEILSLSDRILVLYDGRIAGEFQRGQVSEQELGLRMGGAHA